MNNRTFDFFRERRYAFILGWLSTSPVFRPYSYNTCILLFLGRDLLCPLDWSCPVDGCDPDSESDLFVLMIQKMICSF